MHHGFALRYIADVMGWPLEVEETETAWLRQMSEFKYDGYHDFLSGSRFVEALLSWLQQFKPEDRVLAYKLLKEKLIFINSSEMQHLVRRAFPAHILRHLEARAARKAGVPRYLLGSTDGATNALRDVIRRTLFVGLSDGARLDYFRRANSGVISNEQVISTPEVADGKWGDVHAELKKTTEDREALFEMVVLLDDFTASGNSLLRRKDGALKGKLAKTCAELTAHATSLVPDYQLIVHHYLGTQSVNGSLSGLMENVRNEAALAPLFKGGEPIFNFGMLIPDVSLLRPGSWPELDQLLDKYYDPAVMTAHLEIGGKDVKHGFAHCGLPLVIEHNTPNNSLGILWAESPPDSTNDALMRPLFRRRQRHV